MNAGQKWGIYCPNGSMPNEGRDEQPYATKAEAVAAVQRWRRVWADSASIARIQWNNARVLPYTGAKCEPFTLPDLQRKVTHPEGTVLLVSLFRGTYHVAAEDHRGTFHAIGGFNQSEGAYAFADGVKVGDARTRKLWVDWAATLDASDLPKDDTDPHYKGSLR